MAQPINQGAATIDADEPIAIIAMACRTPGGVADPEGYWSLLDDGRDAIGAFSDRWDAQTLFDPDPDAVGKTYSREGGFVSDVESFDAEFFGISPREAISMDPQQRLVLEVAWEALERAGLPPDSLGGSATGVYLGAQCSDYGLDAISLEELDGYRLTGRTSSVLSGRVSYLWDLHGPAITVDTACSSSLTALHLAASALRSGECTMALAGGVQVMSTPSTFVEFSRLRGLAPDGRCKAFSNTADGAGWSEGAGILVLKRLSDAQRAGDQVLALIRGSAVNQDGRSMGLTAPNGPAQQQVITQALANAGIGPDQVDVIEAHGTGTPLGDSIEADALMKVFGPTRDAQHPLWLGSSKSNIGHSQAAAGVLGVMKIVLALQHERLPKTLHAQTPNEQIVWEDSGLALLQQSRLWPHTHARVRRAGVSSFGISGTNVHMVLEEACAPAVEPELVTTEPPAAGTPVLRVWPVSARSAGALCAQADRLGRYVGGHPGLDLGDVAYSLATTRTHHPYRAVVVVPADSADPRAELLAGLDALGDGQSHPGLIQHHQQGALAGKTVFVFPGQGAQYAGMAAGLYAEHPVFAAAIDECDQALGVYTGWSVRGVICGDPAAPALDRVDVVQPVLFAVMVSLARTLISYGVSADAVVGHSQGEIAAAYVAGVFSLSEAAKIVALRSAALGDLSGAGGMASVLLGVDELGPRLGRYGDEVEIAAVNGPTQTVVSGQCAAVERFVADCEADNVQVRPIAVDYASHCSQVEPLRQRLVEDLAGLAPAPARVPVYSTVGSMVSGQPLDTTVMTADYWYANLRERVGFYDVVAGLLAAGDQVFVELSSHPVLTAAIADACSDGGGRGASVVVPTLHRDRGDLDALSTAVGRLHVHGHVLSWPVLYPGAQVVQLPTYAFQRRRYWLTPRLGGDVSGAGLDRAQHPLLGAITALADQDQVVASGRLSIGSQGWLAGHRVGGAVVLAGAALVDVVLQAGDYVHCPVIDELVLHAPLVLTDDAPTDVQIVVAAAGEGGRRSFTVHARRGDHDRGTGWVRHASGVLGPDQGLAGGSPGAAVPVDAVDVDSFYQQLATHGLEYGSLFRSLRGIAHDPADPDHVYAEVALPADTDITGYGLHPALLDAALQPLAVMLGAGTDDESDRPSARLPFAFTGVCLYASAATRLQVWLTRTGTDTFTLYGADPMGAPVIKIDTITLRAVPDTVSAGVAASTSGAGPLELGWVAAPDGLSADVSDTVSWAVLGDGCDGLLAGVGDVVSYPDLDAVTSFPELMVWGIPATDAAAADAADAVDAVVLERVHGVTQDTLARLQDWLARAETTSTHLVVVTRHAVSVGVYDRAPDLAHAAVWALLHVAQNEHPGRITLIDTDTSAATADRVTALIAAVGCSSAEPHLAVRDGVVFLPRLSPARALTAPPTPDWQLMTTGKGDLANLELTPVQPATTLASGQIRVQIRAAGLNFHDVVVALGAITDEGLGVEAAGVVIDTADDVVGVQPGDAVMGLFPNNAFAPTAITDHRMVVAVPSGWSYSQAASIPVAFLTAYTTLVDIAQLCAGQRVLIHAGAGGVGQAAIQLASHLGAEVFATAHPSKHHLLRHLGIGDDHIASSRDLDFVEKFSALTGERGMDVVLNSLRGEFVDASLQLLGSQGCFIEIGKTDVRGADDITAAHPNVGYHVYDLATIPAPQLHQTWPALVDMLNRGVLTALPTTSYGLLRAAHAFRDMSQGRHSGKIVLLPPPVLDPQGTVLITGGTGTLGAVFAEHLVTTHGVRHLLLTSRRGASAPHADELAQRLTELGADVRIAACDSANPTELAALLESIPTEHRLTAVVHTAVVLDDAVVTELTPTQLDTVLAAKADAAWHLHHLTQHHDLAAFVLFSSVAATLGAPGLANYAAANAVLDALAHHRHHHQQPATSLAWGYWQTPSGMTAHLDTRDQTRFTRIGMTPISIDHGLALFDTALSYQHPNLVPAPLNPTALAALAERHSLPPMLSALITSRPHAAAADSRALTTQLANLTPEQQRATLTSLVITTTAQVLAHPDPQALDPDRPFKDLGIDSLSALELRNTLSTQTGLTLPATLAFDHPTPNTLADHLTTSLSDNSESRDDDAHDAEIRRLIASIPVQTLRDEGVLDILLGMVGDGFSSHQDHSRLTISEMDLGHLVNLAMADDGI
ncbi:SDR family NAD(P)-dependent oxidoreductase [Mycobacterium spongiae]|uniref:SDR family NAD(P)-dependent oxidoreductase n=2 Tax=Mycobacterium spongiae TaxID=886343 RepID=A0A975K0S0_9MYCO|nr:type I polyketide synthase [Mycobacterium spongiae]QUR69261.1 SDR family NAD(P)-dependent oxidoreductase [Mycobacterium spongiae]